MASIAERVDRAVFFTDYMDLKNPHDTYLYENKQDGITKNTIVILRFGGISTINRPYIDATAVYDEQDFTPFAITFSKDKFYVTDMKTIRIFNNKFQLQENLKNEEIISPRGIYASENRLYVVDGTNKEHSHQTPIFIFNLDMEIKSRLTQVKFADPWSLKINVAEELIFVSDSGARQVNVIDIKTGNLVISINMPQNEGRQMLCRGLDIDENDNVFVALRVEGLRRQFECIRMYTKESNLTVSNDIFENLSSLGFATGYLSNLRNVYSIKEDIMKVLNLSQNKQFHLIRGIHYKNMNGKRVLFVTDSGNDSVRMLTFEKLSYNIE